MSELLLIITGFVLGILFLAVIIIFNACHVTEFHEIHWYDAQKEIPSEYVMDGMNAIHILIHNKRGAIIDCIYYLDKQLCDMEDWKNVTHFAYIEEIKHTVPPCPVCTNQYQAPNISNPMF